MRNICIAAACILQYSSLCYGAVFDFQVLSGRRVVELETQTSPQGMHGDGQGSSMSLAAHWTIDPEYPIAVGLSTARESLYFAHPDSHNSDILYGHSFHLELYAWLPLQRFAPYMRFTHLLSSQYQRLKTGTYQPGRNTHQQYADSWTEQGNHLSLGCAVTIAPSVGALLEWQKSFESSLKSNLHQTISLNSQNFRAGIEIGL